MHETTTLTVFDFVLQKVEEGGRDRLETRLRLDCAEVDEAEELIAMRGETARKVAPLQLREKDAKQRLASENERVKVDDSEKVANHVVDRLKLTRVEFQLGDLSDRSGKN